MTRQTAPIYAAVFAIVALVVIGSALIWLPFGLFAAAAAIAAAITFDPEKIERLQWPR